MSTFHSPQGQTREDDIDSSHLHVVTTTVGESDWDTESQSQSHSEMLPIRTGDYGSTDGRVWIEYCDASATTAGAATGPIDEAVMAPELKVYINHAGDRKPSTPAVHVTSNNNLQLHQLFDPTSKVHVGWTSSVSGIGPRDNHDILSWTGIDEQPCDGSDTSSIVPTTAPTLSYRSHFVDEITYVDSIVEPGDWIEAFNVSRATWTEGPDKAIDGTTSKFYFGFRQPEYMSYNGGVGFEFIPSQSSCTVVQGMVVFAANDAPVRDPISLVLEGRKTFDGQYEEVGTMSLSFLDDERNEPGQDLDKESQHYQEVAWDNQQWYIQYRVSLKGVRNAHESQFAEIQFPGFLCPEDYHAALPATMAPSISMQHFVDHIMYVDSVVKPGDPIQMFGTTNYDVDRAIDGKTTHWHIPFKSEYDLSYNGGVGFEVTPSQSRCSVVQGMVVFAADAVPDFDPTSLVLEGRKTLDGEYEEIGTMTLSFSRLLRNRVPDLPIDKETQHYLEVSWDNLEWYTQYRLSLRGVRNSVRREGHFAEVLFPGFLCPQNYTLFPSDYITHNPTTTPAPSTLSLTTTPMLPSGYVQDLIWLDNLLSPRDYIEKFGSYSHVHDNIDKLIDGTSARWFGYPEHYPIEEIGCEIVPNKSKCSIVQGITFFMPQDKPEQDVVSYVLEGRSSRDTGYQLISKGNFHPPMDRGPSDVGTIDISSPHHNVTFYNRVPYTQYRLSFPTIRNGHENMHQHGLPAWSIAEIWFSGYLCSEEYPEFNPYPTQTPTSESVTELTAVESILQFTDMVYPIGLEWPHPDETIYKIMDGTTTKFSAFVKVDVIPAIEFIPWYECTIVQRYVLGKYRCRLWYPFWGAHTFRSFLVRKKPNQILV